MTSAISLHTQSNRFSNYGNHVKPGENIGYSQASPSDTKADPANEQEKVDQEIQRLKQRDREVRSHEMAHFNSLGPYKSGPPTFGYTTGPDGQKYASSGNVPVDLSKEENPEKTITKAQVIKRAALAPADPSDADHRVAARAAQMETEARLSLLKQGQDKELSPQLPQNTLGDGSENERQYLSPEIRAYSKMLGNSKGSLLTIHV